MESVEYQLIETVVRRTLADIQDSPERTIRNLIDMALHFAEEGKFERDFFSIAQHMLEDSHSAYYDLVKDAAMNVDTQRILRFGMNLGYNGCALGAKIIRQTEEAHRFNIPWSLTLMMDTQRFFKLEDRYHDLVREAKELGIYTFLISKKGSALNVLPLIKAHDDCAFVLFCEAEDVTPELIKACEPLHHLMIAVYLSSHTDEACRLLREKKFLYSLSVPYAQEEAKEIISGELFETAQTLHPAFTLLTPQESCPEALRRDVYDAIRSAREKQQYRTIPLDTIGDFEIIDSIISQEACNACIDESGTLWAAPDRPMRNAGSVFEASLFDVLREAFPKA